MLGSIVNFFEDSFFEGAILVDAEYLSPTGNTYRLMKQFNEDLIIVQESFTEMVSSEPILLFKSKDLQLIKEFVKKMPIIDTLEFKEFYDAVVSL